ncbi:lamin tail domain-containing protein [Antarcticibacterium sp. 1MA-6-2]|uniref:lamin tail domain-containing protein n=1 Tax=Antarcticibacterium sp. 1MA-6-2 TaxID=2908210 RepID=UPI001F24ECBC|nr:lamin tail domain-containing protein [Antarcticibacterium sp. 1MA-6-2]UJH91349.1 lamin tail domain-containing protein [Antarcticibacterium sp. 1MA-6-2]
MKKKLHIIGFIASFLVTFLLPAQSVFINEIHYDNDGGDLGEAVEIASPAGTDLAGWTVVLYNGNNSASYGTINLEGTIADQQGGFGTVSFTQSGIQNGAPDGLALVNAEGVVVQFLSYEGTMTATDGPAAGMTSTDIGVAQSGSDPVGHSLQLGGEGNTYSEFAWQTSIENTFGAINTNQSFGGEVTTPEPEPEPELPLKRLPWISFSLTRSIMTM